MRSPTASIPRATGGRGVRYARRLRRTLCSHDGQRASRKLSVHAVALCASCPPLYCPGATRPRQACSQSSSVVLPHAFGLPAIVARWTWCATSTAPAAAESTATTPMHSPAHRLALSGCQLSSQGGPCVRLARHRRRQKALRQRCTARRIGGCDKHCDTTTMHNPTAFHTDA